MEGVLLKIPLGALQEVQEQVQLVTAPQISVPDYLTILGETEYEFSLENWVMTGLQGGYSSQPVSPVPSSSSETQPSCPPYWQMLSSPQQSRLASRHSSDFWEPNPRQRSHSLNPSVLRSKVKFTVSDSEDEVDGGLKMAKDERNATTGKVPVPEKGSPGEGPPPVLRHSSARKAQKAFTPDLLNPPACLSSLPHQRRKNLRQCSLSVLETPSGGQEKAPSPTGSSSQHKSQQVSDTHRPPNARANTVDRVPTTEYYKPTHPSLSPYSPFITPTLVTSRPLGSLGAALDSSVELLSALSPEERDLMAAITERGYPLRTAIITLQKRGQQSPEQILSYLVACDHLCELGYDEAQVEEALEMFQNSETKAKEFLHLLSQFNEMGFQQNAIKEVLLVHDNHRERALEELMMRMA